MKPKLLLVLALVLSGGLFGCSTTYHGQLSAEQREQVKESLKTLKPGMTEHQVLDTLAKTPWKYLKCHIDGGGSESHNWDLYSPYPTTNVGNLLLVFDRTTGVRKFVEYELCGDGWKTNE